MWPVAGLSVCLSVVNIEKTAKPIEVPLRCAVLRTQCGTEQEGTCGTQHTTQQDGAILCRAECGPGVALLSSFITPVWQHKTNTQ